MPRRSSRGRPGYSSAAAPRPAGGGTPADALDTGLRLLGRRAHSRLELRRKLRRKGYDEDAITGAVVRLSELGYLDDASFASGLVRRRAAQRGPLALSAELAAKGVDRAQAAAAVAAFDPEAQLLSATRIAERLYAKAPVYSYRELLDRVGTKLLRRGFSTTVVRAACQAVLTSRSAEPEDEPSPPAV